MKTIEKILTILSYLAVAVNAGTKGQPFWVCFALFTGLLLLNGIYLELKELNERRR